jgi:hypothetical protein
MRRSIETPPPDAADQTCRLALSPLLHARLIASELTAKTGCGLA